MARTTRRIPGIDLARTAAIVGMVAFHLVRDLEMFGFVSAGTTLSGGWAIFARLVAGAFLFLAGVSLVLAHGENLQLRKFLIRIGKIAAAAGLVTLGTWIAMPDRFVYFGVLHAIALSSVVGLAFLFVPWWVALLSGFALILAPVAFNLALFESPALLWLGLTKSVPPTLDYLPLVPWAGPCLLGVAVTAWLRRGGYLDLTQSSGSPRQVIRWLSWPGRHSLVIYMIHQPILIGSLWAMTRLLAPG